LQGNVVTLRSALADAFFFVAYRSFVAAVVTRAVLIASVFVLAFANHASAQDSLLTRFIGNFFNDSQDIPNSPWPYNSGPPSELRKFPARPITSTGAFVSMRSTAWTTASLR
jgi:hypothetical protein